MTKERRQDLAVVAVALSLAAHVGLMFLIRPQVMTHVTAGERMRRPQAMTVREAPPTPETVRLEVLRETEAARPAPEAEAEEMLPGGPSVADPVEAAAAEAAPEAVPPPDLSVGEPRFAPHLSEKLHVDPGVPSFETPVASEPSSSAVPMSAPAPVAAPSDVPVPLFTAPVIAAPAGPSVRDVLPAASAPASPTDAFTPLETVLSEVDEKVVEAEKDAVRELLDVRSAEELAEFVSVSAESANEGEWTYFRVTLAPSRELPIVPKDVVVLLDASGSIGDDRLRSCRAAARQILRSVTNTGDRFNLVAFRDRFSYAFRSWQDCTQESFGAADKWLDRLVAHGRTDVFATIRSVLTLPRDPSRPLVAMVVTDGDANEGVRETAQILSKFTALNDGLVSVYMYGVKAAANRELIDVLTHGNRGESFVYDGVRGKAGSALADLSARFRDPVLSDLRVVFPTAAKAESYPRLLRNLYRGETVPLTGRVPRGAAEVAFSVKGLNGRKPFEGFFRVPLSGATFDRTLPDAWRRERDLDRKLR